VTPGSTFTHTITATGTGPIYYDVVSPPSWLTTINHLTGVISGVTPGIGTVNLTITATNVGGTDTETLAVTTAFLFAGVTFTGGGVERSVVSGILYYAVGSFTSITDANGTYACAGVACLDLSTRLFTSFRPLCAGGSVLDIALDATYAYLAGTFITIDGVTRNRIGRVALSSSTLDATWNPNANDEVSTVYVATGQILVGGMFSTIGGASRTRFAALANTGTGTANSLTLKQGGASLTYPNVFSSGGTADMVESGGTLHIGGPFSLEGNVSGYLARGYAQVDLATGNVTQLARTAGDVGNGSIALAGAYHNGGMYLVGSFTASLTLPAMGAPSTTRNRALWMDATAIDSWDPNVNGRVDTIKRATNGDLYLSGDFTTVGGGAYAGIVRVDASGTVVTAFNPSGRTNIKAATLGLYGSWIIAAGSFNATVEGQAKTNFVVLDATTGALI
jgi:hypothetical protein